MSAYRVLVLGGYGFFGARLVRRLALQDGLHILVAGRSIDAANALVASVRPTSTSSLEGAAVDAMSATFLAQLRELRPSVVVHTAGPFQSQDYRVAQACIAAGVHYVDLADAREFVCGVGELDHEAKAARVFVVSGASSVPALSGAVCDSLALGLARVDTIDVGISPGNRTERGLATMRAILGYCGQPIGPSGDSHRSRGWIGRWRFTYDAPVGTRLLSPCDVPDLALLPARYAGKPQVRFGAGLELKFMHFGMNGMAWLVKAGLMRNWSRHAVLLKRIADWFQHWGTDAGAMHVSLSGFDAQGRNVMRSWQLLALHGDGPYVPTLAASALVRKLAAGEQLPVGAMPCVGVLSVQDFERECKGLAITMRTP
ncbi:MAG: saccharopine dehydrogenase NADP-binding domain-containing protein [Ramlibacter sp.]|nr:saccharopine dehydrogenase NADP-binding domain-containing protein [Ramlibacter sp.]